jgi:hypothetical protein
MFFYSVSLRWTGTYIIDPCLLSSGMAMLALFYRTRAPGVFFSFGFVSFFVFVARSAAAHAVRLRAFCRVAAHVLVIHVSPLESIFRPFFVTQSS